MQYQLRTFTPLFPLRFLAFANFGTLLNLWAFLFVCCLWSFAGYAQNITNIRLEAHDNGKSIRIKFDVAPTIHLKIDKIQCYSTLLDRYFDIQNITPALASLQDLQGNNQEIIWNSIEEGRIINENIKIKFFYTLVSPPSGIGDWF
jgi:hypothetical protein